MPNTAIAQMSDDDTVMLAIHWDKINKGTVAIDLTIRTETRRFLVTINYLIDTMNMLQDEYMSSVFADALSDDDRADD